MKQLLKISFLFVIIGFVMIALFYIKNNESFISVMNKVVISEYESGLYSKWDLELVKSEVSLNKNVKAILINAKYIDVQISENIDTVKVEYYNFPGIMATTEPLNEEMYSLYFTYPKYQIVFNKNLKEYQRVKVTVPKNYQFEHFWVNGQEINIDGINSNVLMILPIDYNGKGYINLSNLNVNEGTIMTNIKEIDVKNSKINNLKINCPDLKLKIDNVKGDNLSFGSVTSKDTLVEYLKDYKDSNQKVDAVLNKVEFKNYGFYSRNLSVKMNNGVSLNDYYFKMNSVNGTNTINNKKYENNYESTNYENSKYKIETVSTRTSLQIN